MCNSPLVLANGFPDDKRYIPLFHEIKVLPQHLFECVKPCHIPSFLSEPTNPFRLQKRQLCTNILVPWSLILTQVTLLYHKNWSGHFR